MGGNVVAVIWFDFARLTGYENLLLGVAKDKNNSHPCQTRPLISPDNFRL